jgi:hypothetical protein
MIRRARIGLVVCVVLALPASASASASAGLRATKVNFGNAPAGTQLSETVTVTNRGSEGVGFASGGVAGYGNPTLSDNTCLYRFLEPGESCTVTLQVIAQPGHYAGTVYFGEFFSVPYRGHGN